MIKYKNKIVGLCHGVFDVLHFGHINYLKEARRKVDYLVVSVTSDKFVDKGPGRPIFSIDKRVQVLAELKFIDEVIVSNELTASKVIKKLKPDFYFKGRDYELRKSKNDKNLKEELKTLKHVGGKFRIIKKETYSSSKIINNKVNQFNRISDDSINYLDDLLRSKSKIEIINSLEKVKKLKVLVVGEIMIDKYVDTYPVGKSGKENFLVHKTLGEELYVGGVGYVCNLLSDFVKKVECVSFLGDYKKNINFIKKQLNKKIHTKFFIKKNSPTITKTRYLEKYKGQKFFGLYDINDDFISEKDEIELTKYLSKKIKQFDIIVVVDYGHGILDRNFIKFVNKNWNKVYLNTQINSFNRIFHSVDKYQKANTIVINEGELRTQQRSMNDNLDDLVEKLQKKILFKNLSITRGKLGSIFYNFENKKIKKKITCPALVGNTTDPVGSGDTYLALLSICLKAGLIDKVSNLVASIGASYCVQQIGHKNIIKFDQLKKYLKNLLNR